MYQLYDGMISLALLRVSYSVTQKFTKYISKILSNNRSKFHVIAQYQVDMGVWPSGLMHWLVGFHSDGCRFKSQPRLRS